MGYSCAMACMWPEDNLLESVLYFSPVELRAWCPVLRLDGGWLYLLGQLCCTQISFFCKRWRDFSSVNDFQMVFQLVFANIGAPFWVSRMSCWHLSMCLFFTLSHSSSFIQCLSSGPAQRRHPRFCDCGFDTWKQHSLLHTLKTHLTPSHSHPTLCHAKDVHRIG